MKIKFIILIILLCFQIKSIKSGSIGSIKNKILHNILNIPLNMMEKIPYKVTNHVNADIVICPSGRYGAYQLGICHYIKNNFDIKHKKILGFSAGSLNAMFLSIHKEHDNDCLKQFFKIKSKKIPMLLKKSLHVIESYGINDYDIENTYIGVSTTNGLVIHNKFMTMQDITTCCIASSFVPYLTHNDIFYFYKNSLSMDGGIYCKQYLKTMNESNCLIIKFTMFGRYKNINMFNEVLKKTKPSTYDLYLTGYHDAQVNHAYFEKIL